MKEKYLWLGIAVVFISWIGNYLYFESKQLEQPIFLDHYYERQFEEETQLTFYYLTNKQDPLDVHYVEIDGVEVYPVTDQGFMMWHNNQPQVQYEREFQHQYLKKITLNFQESMLPLESDVNEAWGFNSMNVQFSDGTKVDAGIGNVRLHSKFVNPQVLEFRSGSSSNQHRESTSLVTTEAITIDNIKIPFAEELAQDIAVKVDADQDKLNDLETLKHSGNPPSWYKDEFEASWRDVPGTPIQDDLFPLDLEQGSWIRLFMHFNPERTSYFNFGIEISGTTDTGEPFVMDTLIHDSPYLEQDDVNHVIADKQGGGQK